MIADWKVQVWVCRVRYVFVTANTWVKQCYHLYWNVVATNKSSLGAIFWKIFKKQFSCKACLIVYWCERVFFSGQKIFHWSVRQNHFYTGWLRIVYVYNYLSKSVMAGPGRAGSTWMSILWSKGHSLLFHTPYKRKINSVRDTVYIDTRSACNGEYKIVGPQSTIVFVKVESSNFFSRNTFLIFLCDANSWSKFLYRFSDYLNVKK